MIWLAGFGALSVCGLLLAAYSRDEDARLLAFSLVALCVVSAASWLSDVMHLVPMADWLIGCFAFVMWDVRRAPWLRLFVNVCAIRLGIHVGISLAPVGAVSLFYHLLNATFVTQVFLVSKQGGIRLGTDCAAGLRGWFSAVRASARATVARLARDG